MALRLGAVTPSPLLDQPAFAPDGKAARLRTYSGEVSVVQDSGVLIYTPHQIDATPMGFVPPDAEAIRSGEEPALAAEVTLAQILPVGSSEHFNGTGAAGVVAVLQPDQAEPGWSWPFLSLQALGTRPMVLRYRLTVLTPVPESGT